VEVWANDACFRGGGVQFGRAALRSRTWASGAAGARRRLEPPKLGSRCASPAFSRPGGRHLRPRACGDSDPDFGDVSIAHLGGDVISVADACGLDRFALVGWSLGGAVAIDAAARLGDRLARLVITGGATPRMVQASDWPVGFPEGMAESVLQAINDDRIGFYWQMAESLFHQAVSPHVVQWAWQQWMESGVASALSYANLFEIDQRAQMAALTVPTLLIHGRHDTLVPYEIASCAAQLLINGKLMTFEQSGHAPFLEEGASYVSALLQFLAA